jgi:hypothetical protein
MVKHIKNSEKKDFLKISFLTETISKLIGAFLLTIYIFFSTKKYVFFFSYVFRTNLEFVYFFAIILNLFATLMILLFWPTFFVLNKVETIFPRNAFVIWKSLTFKSKLYILKETFSVGLNQFCQVNFPSIICSRITISFANFVCLSEMKPLDIGASYGALNLFCLVAISASTELIPKQKRNSKWWTFLFFFRSSLCFIAFVFYERYYLLDS